MSRKGWSIYKQISHYLGPGVETEINCKRAEGSYWNDGNVLKQYGSHGCAKMINLLEIIELHPWNRWIWRPVNYTSIKLLLKTWIFLNLGHRSSDCMDPWSSQTLAWSEVFPAHPCSRQHQAGQLSSHQCPASEPAELKPFPLLIFFPCKRSYPFQALSVHISTLQLVDSHVRNLFIIFRAPTFLSHFPSFCQVFLFILNYPYLFGCSRF